ncbi:MAG: alpha/beta hydrolase [Gemmataceae bacterium]
MPFWTHPASGTRLAYDDCGSGPPLVLVHAFPLDRRMWAAQAGGLSHSHRVLTPDVFGFGESGLPAGGWTMDSFADALADWLTALHIDKAVVGGLSMGGYIALAFARRRPSWVRGLILADTRAEADSAEAKVNREKTIALAEEKGAAGVIEQMLPKMVSDHTRAHRPEVVEAVRSLAVAQSTAGVVSGVRALRDRPDSTAATMPSTARLGEGGMRITSAPASTARTAASSALCSRAIALISIASVKSRPSNPMASRSSSVKIAAFSVEGARSPFEMPGTEMCAVITAPMPASIAAWNGLNSTESMRARS